MSKDFDLNEQLRSDAKRIRRLNGQGVNDIGIGALIEYSLWTLSLVSVGAMIVTMPWVGSGKPIPGVVWLGYSLAGMVLFGGLAVLIRWGRTNAGSVDAEMNSRLDAGRGR